MEFNPTPLVEAKADIMAHAELFNMANFVLITNDREPDEAIKQIDCGTVFCIAGSIVIRHCGIIVDSEGDVRPGNLSGQSASNDDWIGYACAATGMTYEEGRALFYQWNWEKIAPKFYNIEHTPVNACIVIDEFLRQKGYDPRGQPA